MKKIFFILLIVMLSVPALAQTNFRDVTYKEAIVIARAEKKTGVYWFLYILVRTMQDDDEEYIPVKRGRELSKC